MEVETTHEQWANWARRWALLGQPMRPTPHDIEYYQDVLRSHSGVAAPRALMLGVTPEIATQAWPERTNLTAIDQSRGMIEAVWPRDQVLVPSQTIEADWLAMPVPDASQDIVIGDGCYTAMPTLASGDALLAEARRVLAPEGLLVQRVFVGSEVAIPLKQIFEELVEGAFGHFQGFKLKLLANVGRAADASVRLGDVWEAWAKANVDREALVERLGWDRAIIDTIDEYRGNEGRYRMATLPQVLEHFGQHFTVIEHRILDYPLAQYCPTLVCRPRS